METTTTTETPACQYCLAEQVATRWLPQPTDDETAIEYVPFTVCTYCGSEQVERQELTAATTRRR